MDGSIKFIGSETGKVESSNVPTGDVITSIGYSNGCLACGTKSGDVLIWEHFGQGVSSKIDKVSSYLDYPVTVLKFVDRTPLLMAGTDRGEVLVLNYSDISPIQKIVLQNQLPISNVLPY